MFTRVSIQLLLVPTVFYLILIQCKLSDASVQDSGSIWWTDVDMAKDEWEGIQNLTGKNPCAEGMKYCMALATIVKNRLNADALRKTCEQDLSVTYPNKSLIPEVCWIRQKKDVNVGVKRTVYEVQFWSESPTMSNMRYASPKWN
uniref:Uncharacterized protein n=1 Tax=Cacopsylla melanoneura TaxID=428564 RepID=A0A8D8QTA2_9HEMI